MVRVNAASPAAGELEEAAQLLRSGDVVAFPTETVYGLGANALNARAVSRIYEAKGRPATNPVIVHVESVAAARELVLEWPHEAEVLSQTFWPGPLTLVLPKSPQIPSAVTAGGSTVAVRVPANPVALALLRTSGLPLAAPSANPSCSLSPTTADHVLAGLDGRIPLILDGGPCSGGIESTVVMPTENGLTILRPGIISAEELSAAVKGAVTFRTSSEGLLKSPGQLERHYCPRTALRLTNGSGVDLVKKLAAEGGRVGWLTFEEDTTYMPQVPAIRVMPETPADYARLLYGVLHEMDDSGVDVIVCELPPDQDSWAAVRDRLQRAAT